MPVSHDFRGYNRAVQDLLARDAWQRLGADERLEEVVETVREQDRQLADEGALPALVFVQVTGRVTDRDALLSFLREHDRLSEPANGEEHDDSALLHDALLTPVEYEPAEDREESVWIASVARTGILEGGELLIEVPLQVDAVGFGGIAPPTTLNSSFRA